MVLRVQPDMVIVFISGKVLAAVEELHSPSQLSEVQLNAPLRQTLEGGETRQ